MLRLVAIVSLLTFIGCGSPKNADPAAGDDGPALRKVRLALNWFPEAEHGGFYAAQQQGFFAEEGLDVEIIPGGPGVPVIQQVASGNVEFAVANADQVILGRAQMANVVALMSPMEKSPRCILVHEQSPIKTFNELENCTLAMNVGRSFAVFLQKKLPLKNVRIVPYNGNLAQFISDPNMAQQAYVFSEPYVAKEKGVATRSLMMHELGFNPYTSILITSDDLLDAEKGLAEKMTRACIKGWKHYLEHPQETNNVISTLNPELDVAALQFGAEAIQGLALPTSDDQFGRMTLARWTELLTQMEEVGMTKPGQVNPDDCFAVDVFALATQH
ncbi:ABC transporter substrate-binding protein [Blastopirellula sp. JC732]|uniref:ABC transporter substrate-binding protein n=1 Tax=Blastopirellula sediminis TaxID=2894196 RepID=A0A9X1SHR1_9BACT|nr:ABC transporter substrate-binding protein [Blastopirellula sediminis]MCC9606315.1 ABC transporter substrate-binding protein [Blastopirellula sediminis]MCC9630387.1 ABC transporter substrate-binding protein [Blastopirellula sediminis]